MAAILCGADAVYIGGPKFGARAAAVNDLSQIERLVQFAHRYWAKVYVAVNTLLQETELAEARQLIESVRETGADAVIIQDMGILEMDIPIPLIASTQAHNDTWQKIEFLENVGFQRVILARELNIDEIREIRSKVPNIELECFVHGALCVSYSGQCYLSYACGGRSGNRGECAQPCRKLYSLCDARGNVLCRDKHLLSLKDLDYSAHLRELMDAGITSFKIEGRLKDLAYVKNTVSFYRHKLDLILRERGWQKSSSGRSRWDFTPDPSKTFNRGYSDYFLHGRQPGIASPDTPKPRGEFWGKVSDFDGESFAAGRFPELHSGDGISFFHQGVLAGTLIEVRGERVYPNNTAGIKNGQEIFRNLDHEFLKRLGNAGIERKIEARLAFREQDGELCLSAVDEDAVKAALVIDCARETAKNPTLALANIERQLVKLGETEFEAVHLEVDLPAVYFMPLRVLNEARRSLMAQLAENRLARYREQKAQPLRKNDFPYPEPGLTPYHNVMNSLAEKFYRRHQVRDIQPALEAEEKLEGKKVMTTRHCLKYMLEMCPKEGFSGHLPEPLYLVDGQGRKLLLRFNCPACKMEVIMPSL